MADRSCLSIVLAAGEGTRMRSSRAKVLHPVAGLPMVAHVLGAARRAGGGQIALVVGRDADEVRAAAEAAAPGVESFVQAERLGTAHAVLAAREAIARGADDLLVMFGDTPLIEGEALAALRAALAGGATVAVMGFHTDSPAGYGRLIIEEGELVAIREDRDCSEAERAVTFCNGGLMGIAGAEALPLLGAIGDGNAKGEYYLTDIVAIAQARGFRVVAVEAAAENALGVNTRVELSEAEAIWQKRRRRDAMLGGATLVAPESVFFSHDTALGRDILIEPNVFFGPGVAVGDGAVIHAFSHIEGATIGLGAEVGPFARLRPGAELGSKSKVGNFCEVKKAVIEPGAKVNHLTYIGDAHIGAKANIGAGTITCNYDGVSKHRTEIGAGAFIGSNTALVAPVTVGSNAIVAAGSVITDAVPDDALALGRGRQVNIEGRAALLRERYAARKSQKSAQEK